MHTAEKAAALLDLPRYKTLRYCGCVGPPYFGILEATSCACSLINSRCYEQWEIAPDFVGSSHCRPVCNIGRKLLESKPRTLPGPFQRFCTRRAIMALHEKSDDVFLTVPSIAGRNCCRIREAQWVSPTTFAMMATVGRFFERQRYGAWKPLFLLIERYKYLCLYLLLLKKL